MDDPIYPKRRSLLMKRIIRVGLAHDLLNQWGGGERVMMLFHQIFPQSPVWTIAHNPRQAEFKDLDIRPSFIQKLPYGQKKFQWYLTLFPLAVGKLRFKGFDLILSDSSGFIKNLKKPKGVMHVCYMHTPTRYLTIDSDYYKQIVPRIVQPIMPFLLRWLKKLDFRGAQRIDVIIANSQETAKRIEKYYHRVPDAVIFPPCDSRVFYRENQDKIEDYYLIAGRHASYKRFDLAISACNQLGRKLKVIGIGAETEKLKALAGPTVEFMGKVSDASLRQTYARARAMLFPPFEDAGMTPLESMACGRPVIAYQAAGALETVIDGKTGVFFKDQTVEGMIEGIKRFEVLDSQGSFDQKTIIKHAESFNETNFKAKILKVLQQEAQKFFKEDVELI